MANYFKSEKTEQTFIDATRNLATFNGAGVAGVIAMLQRPGDPSKALVVAGGVFLLGILFAGASWVMAFLVEEHTEKLARKLGDPMVGCLLMSAMTFLVSVGLAFYAVLAK